MEPDKAKRKKRPPGKYCVAALCRNTNVNDGVSLFKFPKDADLAKAWDYAVKKTRADWTQHTPPQSSL